MRSWQKLVSDAKRKRHEHRIMIENIAAAINYHEQSLRTKTLLSFIKYRVLAERERYITRECQKKVRVNMLRWYFGAIVKKYSEVKWFESGKHIALLFKVKVTLRKVLLAWQNTIKSDKARLLRMRQALFENTKAAQILFDMMGKEFLGKKFYNRLDIDEVRMSLY